MSPVSMLRKFWLKGKYVNDFIEDTMNLTFRICFYQSRPIRFEIRKALKIIGVVSPHFKNAQTVSFPANGEIEVISADAYTLGHIG